MTEFPIVRFVSAPEVGADVRFDFNAGDTWVEHDGFDLGTPSLEGDPDGIGVEYGYRRLVFDLRIDGHKDQALAAMSPLARELLRRTNWLEFQVDAFSRPVWFKTYRTAPGTLSLEDVSDRHTGDSWQIGVTLDADPFAYGERVTLDPVTVSNDPAAATNPMSYTLPTILGDAPAPLAAVIDPSTSVSGTSQLQVYNGPAVAPVVMQASAMTAYTDTGASTSSSSYSGGEYREVSFATDSSHRVRLNAGSQPLPAVGTYRLMARVSRSDATSTFTLQVQVGDPGEERFGDKVAVTGSTGDVTRAALVPLGDLELPPTSSQEQPALVSPSSQPDVSFKLLAGRTSGTGALRIDYLIAVPVASPEAQTTTLRYLARGIYGGGVSDAVAIDGEIDALVYARTGMFGLVTPADRVPPVASGDLPVVTPGTDNVAWFFPYVGGDLNQGNWSSNNYSDKIATTTTLTLSYRPRYLYLAGD